MPISIPTQIAVPFATSGLKNPIPAFANPVSGNAGYDQGFPPITMTPKTAGGIPPFGQDFNGVFFDITTAIQFLEAGGSFPYDSVFATAVGGYPLGALLSRTDGSGLWRNTIANNTTDPEVFGAGWQPEDAGATTVAMTNANVTLTALQSAKSMIVITGTITANLQLILPIYVKQWLIVNKSSGAFTVTVKTAAGSGVVTSSNSSQAVYGDGVNITASATQTAQSGSGQCRLGFVSATSIKLSPLNGQSITIGGVARQLPSAGVTVSNATLAASTLYYIYAFWTGSAVSIEASVTGHSTDATTGVEIKTGDATRSLVGMIFTNASSQFSDSVTARHVASWFNRRDVGGVLISTTQTTFTTGVLTEVSAIYRTSFLSWGEESTDVRMAGQYLNGTAGTSVSMQTYVDGSPYGNLSASYEAVINGGIVFTSLSTTPNSGSPLSEGQHVSQFFAAVTGGTGAITNIANSVMTRI